MVPAVNPYVCFVAPRTVPTAGSFSAMLETVLENKNKVVPANQQATSAVRSAELTKHQLGSEALRHLRRGTAGGGGGGRTSLAAPAGRSRAVGYLTTAAGCYTQVLYCVLQQLLVV